ncbi:hypothetical protein D7Y27_17880 [Corallococcus sp. AB004]|uniref:hypothetical protein n=1 Tax=Corallococcus TaxID=83461 RepID=UPI000EA218FC|nr:MULTISPECIES: hypothetical protein [Corallococcus]NPC75582.1 hypothetical protein [Corallococcus exiguus]RKH93790.1 hypothetical protein D7Y04_38865 [Corallococcus sp. AB038B]RKI41865.1 hypothetical protein D7Y27_17880 [Corallococcus sp. AB004]
MKIGRPVSSLPQPEQSTQLPVHRASGQSILGGGKGSSSSAQGYKDPPDQFQGPQGGALDSPFHRPVSDGGEARPCASGSSVRGQGGGHSGTVSCSFVPADSGAPGTAGSKPSSPVEKLVEKLRDLFAKLLGGAAPEGSHRGRVATGDSSRSAGSKHSGSGQGRIGAEEDLQASDSARVGG